MSWKEKEKGGFDIPMPKSFPNHESTITPTYSTGKGPTQGSTKASDSHTGKHGARSGGGKKNGWE